VAGSLPVEGPFVAAVRHALAASPALVRLPPVGSRLDLVSTLLAQFDPSQSSVLALTPERWEAETLARRLHRQGIDVALWPDEWARATCAQLVVGNRNAAFARIAHLGAIVVLDAHAESYRDQRSPTWNAVVLAKERAQRAGVPCVLVSPCPTLELLDSTRLVEVDRAVERAGWPSVEVIDRRVEDPRSGLYSPMLAPILVGAIEAHPDRPAVCVLNRTGRARLLACSGCGALVRCEVCGSALIQRVVAEPGAARTLHCPSCASEAPAVCGLCGATRLKTLRVGVARAAEELGALTNRPVVEMSGARAQGSNGSGGPLARIQGEGGTIVVGTEAVLHRLRAASIVVFLDFDQELLAPRFRATEQAMVLLARAARLVGGAAGSDGAPSGRAPGRIVIQTRLPEHDVIVAAVRADPERYTDPELARRRSLGLPPTRALAVVSGDGAAELVAALNVHVPPHVAPPDGPPSVAVESVQLGDGRFLVRGARPDVLAEAFAATGLVGSGARVEMDASGP